MSEEIQDLVQQWIVKANGDWQIVEVMTAQESYPRDLICFHCQQYVEKLLKALLTAHEIEFPRTHDLRLLIELAAPHASELTAISDRADELTIHAVQTRYPDNWQIIELSEVERMVSIARELAAIILSQLAAEL